MRSTSRPGGRLMLIEGRWNTPTGDNNYTEDAGALSSGGRTSTVWSPSMTCTRAWGYAPSTTPKPRRCGPRSTSIPHPSIGIWLVSEGGPHPTAHGPGSTQSVNRAELSSAPSVVPQRPSSRSCTGAVSWKPEPWNGSRGARSTSTPVGLSALLISSLVERYGIGRSGMVAGALGVAGAVHESFGHEGSQSRSYVGR